MKLIQAFVWKASDSDKELVTRLIRAVYPEDPVLVTDVLLDNKGDSFTGDVLLAFGTRAYNIVSTVVEQNVYQFTTPAKLRSLPENKIARSQTFEKLKKLAEEKVQVEDVTLTDKELEKFLSKQLVTLQKSLKAKETKYWKATTATGKSIAITLLPNTKVPNCEIILTFEELFAAKYAVEALGVDSLTLTGKQENE